MAGAISEQIKAEIVDLKAEKERVKATSESRIEQIEARIAELNALTIDRTFEDTIEKLKSLDITL